MRRDAERIARGLVVGVGRFGQEFFMGANEGKAVHLRVPATLEEEDTVGGARDVRCTHGMGLVVP